MPDHDKTAQEWDRFEAEWAGIRGRMGIENGNGFERSVAWSAWQARAALDTVAVLDEDAIAAILREHIRVDATGLAPMVASCFVFGFDEAAEAILAAAPQPPAYASADPLGRFGHHPEPATDFCVEVEEIEGEAENIRVGFENGTPSRGELRSRIERAMEFRVGGDEGAVRAKDRLREIEAEFCAPASASAGKSTLQEVGTTPRGYTIYREPNGVGGHRYWSDEIGGGVMVWDTCLAAPETLHACLRIECGDGADKVEPVAWRVRVSGDDTEEWCLLPVGGGADYADRHGYDAIPLYAAPPAQPDDFERGAEAMREACADHLRDLTSGRSIWHQIMRGDSEAAADTIRSLPLPKKEG